MRKARVSDWNGRSLSMGGESSIVKCPDIAESHAMRSWYDSTGHAAETKNMSAGGGGGAGGPGGGVSYNDYMATHESTDKAAPRKADRLSDYEENEDRCAARPF